MISAAKWAREQRIPYFGICLGLQIAAIEFARNVVGIPSTSIPTSSNIDAQSSEFVEDTKDPVVIFMPEGSRTHLGKRLGLRPTIFQSNTEWSIVRRLYGGQSEIHERHRHRYEINPDYIDGASRKRDYNSSDEMIVVSKWKFSSCPSTPTLVLRTLIMCQASSITRNSRGIFPSKF